MFRRVTAGRLWILVCALALAVGLGACGQESQPPSGLNNGVYVDAGPITYQLQVSRELNQYAVEDSQYLAGLPPGTGALAPDQLWYGVFLWAKNQSDQPQLTAKSFVIVDSSHHFYYPIALDAELNAYAWTQKELLPGHSVPIPNTTAYYGPTGGNLLLFKLPTTVYSNRPLTLQITPHSGKAGEISLDL
jgi:hypothetical protein